MPPADDLGFVHAFVPGARLGAGEGAGPEVDTEVRDTVGAGATARHTGRVTLLLLHGTGGNERDLLPLGRELWPGAALLGVRGKVLENGMPRFFRRFAEGIFDVEDLRARTHELARFVEAAARHYRFERRHLVAVGYSNGANIAASLMLLHPDLLVAAVLFRAMVPLRPESAADLRGAPVFLAAGDRDPIVRREQTEELAALLKGGGADVSLFWHRGGHELGQDDLDAAKSWFSGARTRNRLTV
jgi:predicted esterase